MLANLQSLRAKLPKRILWLILACLGILLMGQQWLVGHRPLGSSILYGQLADTRSWIEGMGIHQPGPLQHLKVSINSLKPQTTLTDANGQFSFQGLRDIDYLLKVEVPYDRANKTYQFMAKVDGKTGVFYDLIQDQGHNLHEMDY